MTIRSKRSPDNGWAGRFPEADADLAVDLARSKIARQMDTIDAVDAKTATVLAAGGSLVVLSVAIAALRPRAVDNASRLLLFIAGGLFVVVLAAGVSVLFTRDWRYPPTALGLRQMYDQPNRSAHSAEWRIARQTAIAAEDNQPKLDRKTFLLDLALVLVLAQAALTVAGLLLIANA